MENGKREKHGEVTRKSHIVSKKKPRKRIIKEQE
jgi:hypothetical protein